jgi:plasmid stability protein
MASLTLRNVPDGVMRDLRTAATQEHRSLSERAIHPLIAALEERRASARSRRAAREAQVSAWRALAGGWESDVDAATEAARLMGKRTRGREFEP